MSVDKNVHVGHRQRMINGFLNNPSAFADHQVLEVLLYSVLPRVDTNPIAHNLLNTFGNINNVFNASATQLCAVKGVGKNVASFLIATGEVFKRVNSVKEKSIILSSPSAIKDLVNAFFEGDTTERLVMLLLDKNFKLLAKVVCGNNDKHTVHTDLPELVNAINVHRPTYAVLSHNHTSGNPAPSEEDILSTKKLCLICDINDISLVDHVIVAGDKSFSFKSEGLMDKIVKELTLKNIFNNINK